MKKLILTAVLAVSAFNASAMMQRTYVTEAALEAGVVCVTLQGQSKEVPFVYIKDMIDIGRKGEREGDTIEEFAIKPLNKLLMDNVAVITEARDKGRNIDCASYMAYVAATVADSVGAKDMKEAPGAKKFYAQTLKNLQDLDALIYKDFLADQK